MSKHGEIPTPLSEVLSGANLRKQKHTESSNNLFSVKYAGKTYIIHQKKIKMTKAQQLRTTESGSSSTRGGRRNSLVQRREGKIRCAKSERLQPTQQLF